MTAISTVSTALVVLIILLLLGSLFTGSVLADAEIFKPYTGHRMNVETDAMAQRLKVQAEADARVAVVQAQEAAKLAAAKTAAEQDLIRADTQAQIAVIQAETEATIARIQEDLRVQIRQNDQKIENDANINKVVTILALAFGLGLCVAFARLLFGLAGLASTRPSTVPAITATQTRAVDSWRDSDFRAQAIGQARKREREYRESLIARRTVWPEDIRSGNGRKGPVSVRQSKR
ncbi:MAG TPA: hypothetical protein VFL17_16940 [Anaerolineae bacterium]|nr:hypothetical protein [Anaerolineae bacterium]